MDKITNKNISETRASEEVYIENGNAVFRKVEEVIGEREETTMLIPFDTFMKNHFVFTHAGIVSHVCLKDRFRVYCTDIIKGEDILRIMTDENGECRESIRIVLIQHDGKAGFATTKIKGYQKAFHIRPSREYRIICFHLIDENKYLLGFHKTSHHLFRKHMMLY